VKRKKWLGLPIAVVIGIIAAVSAVGGGLVARGLWGFAQNNTATVRVIADNFAVYKDSACTQVLAPTDTITFGDVRIGSSTGIQHLWLKNTSDVDSAYPTMTVSSLGAGLTLSDSTYGAIGTNTRLYTPAVYSWNQGVSVTLAAAMDTSTTTMVTNTALPSGAGAGMVDGEFIQWANGGSTTTTVVRGYMSSLPVSHNIGATLTTSTSAITITTPATLLAAGASTPLNLSIAAATGATHGVTPQNFTIQIDAVTGY
jgi:hypothetical protein